VNRGL